MQVSYADDGLRAGLAGGMRPNSGRRGVASQNTVYADSTHADGPSHVCSACEAGRPARPPVQSPGLGLHSIDFGSFGGEVTVYGAAQAVFSAPCEGDGPIFAAETEDHWAQTPFVARKLGQSPRERLRGEEAASHGWPRVS